MNMKKYISMAVLVVFIVPSIALASWWNPLSWDIFTFLHKKEIVTQTQITETQNTPENTISKKEQEIIPTPIQENKEVKKSAPSIVDKSTTEKVKIESPNTEQAKITPTKEFEYQRLLAMNSKGKIFTENQPGYQIMQEFLKNPTIENFKIFCSSAKSIDGYTTKQVMSSDRVNLITIKSSLYEGMNYCNRFDKSLLSLLPLDEKLLIELKDNDTDEVRQAKLLLNDKVKNLISVSKVKFIRFQGEGNSPKEQLTYIIEQYKKAQQRNESVSYKGEVVSDDIIERQKNEYLDLLQKLSSCVIDFSNDFYK